MKPGAMDEMEEAKIPEEEDVIKVSLQGKENEETQKKVGNLGYDKEVREISGWKAVSQDKASRTPKMQECSRELITTHSRYAALSNSGEYGEDTVQDEIVEVDDMVKEVAEEGTLNRMIEDAIKRWR